MRAPLLQADRGGDRRPLLHAGNVASLPEAISYTGRGVTVVEERELWDMPILLLSLVGVIVRRVGPAPRLEAGVTAGGRSAGGRGRRPRGRDGREVTARGAGLALLLAAPAFAQATHLLIVVGLPGDPEHGELFQKWATTLVDAAKKKLGVAEGSRDPADATRQATRDARGEGVRHARGDGDRRGHGRRSCCSGHGSFDGKVAKFNLPGPT